jgi:hypothetical protein
MTNGRCTLHDAVDVAGACPGNECPFWLGDDGGAGCVFASVAAELEHRPALAQHLLELRRALEAAGPAADAA